MVGQQGGWRSVGGRAACVVVEGLGSMRGASKVQCSQNTLIVTLTSS